ncbi:MAG: type III secretion system stator protein SctL [Acidobacteriaceae bacterium]|nr:type III secretion system stator protein SctL [Acidobacteriota bacterium]MBV9498317.1 type III secretion system stator protein SctL [Acidobacteriaceae bacterium]
MSSNVIKARTLESMGWPVVVKRNVQRACQDANEIIAQAQEEAQRIVSEARGEAQGIFDSAREEGYQSGAAEWYEVLGNAWKSRDDYLAGNETALLKIAVRIAEKLIGEELRTAPDTIAGIVREALRSVRRAKSLVIQVHPTDTASLNECLSTLRSSAGPAREIEIVPNASLSRGDCIVESDIGVIDARLETQLKNIERALSLKMST